MLRALDDLHGTIDKMSGVGSVTSLVTILRTLRYVAGKSDQLPTDSEALERSATTLKTCCPASR